MAWLTNKKTGARFNTDWLDEDSKRKEQQIAESRKQADVKNTSDKESWRNKDFRFQQKTEGGVYFYHSPNSITGRTIDEKMYNKLPKYIKKSVVMIEGRKTLDGLHCEIFYVNKDGKIEWFDEYGAGDFMYSLKSFGKEEFGNVADWKYDGSYKEGRQLERK